MFTLPSFAGTVSGAFAAPSPLPLLGFCFLGLTLKMQPRVREQRPLTSSAPQDAGEE
jgi:hypothetical protein